MPKKPDDMSLEEIEALLTSKRSEKRTELEAKRDELLSQVAEIEHQIEELGGGSGGRGGKRGPRAKNSMTMKEAIEKAIGGHRGGATLDQITEGVKKLGYVSKAANFKNVVYQTLYNNKEQFPKSDDGKYRVAS